jgi:hypothetical protein
VVDPGELVNRVGDESAVALAASLRARLSEWMFETDDPLALWAGRLL